jgi:hypothetical protein
MNTQSRVFNADIVVLGVGFGAETVDTLNLFLGAKKERAVLPVCQDR